MDIAIETYRPEHAARFAELNRLWLVQFNILEPFDEEQLADPEGHFRAPGGEIFVALDGAKVIGTSAAVPHGPGIYELAKLVVDPAYRGQGIARRLVERCLTWVRERRAERVILVSNSQLQAAVQLYSSFGFEHRPVPAGTGYETADVYMELELT